MPSISKSVVIDAPVSRVFDVITDFESYPDFLPKMTDAEILRSGRGWVEAEFTVEIVRRVDYTLRINMKRPHEVRWKLLEGNMMRSNQGSWVLKSQGRGRTKASYRLRIELDSWIPRMVTDTLISSGIPEMLRLFKERAEERA